jgi:hypothetical protein
MSCIYINIDKVFVRKLFKLNHRNNLIKDCYVNNVNYWSNYLLMILNMNKHNIKKGYLLVPICNCSDNICNSSNNICNSSNNICNSSNNICNSSDNICNINNIIRNIIKKIEN